MANEAALARERAKRCPEGCGKGIWLIQIGHEGVHMPPAPARTFSCTCRSNAADLYEELAKERDTFAKALHDCLGILKIALSDMSGAFVNAVCEEELPRFERLDAIRAAREKETQNG